MREKMTKNIAREVRLSGRAFWGLSCSFTWLGKLDMTRLATLWLLGQ